LQGGEAAAVAREASTEVAAGGAVVVLKVDKNVTSDPRLRGELFRGRFLLTVPI
jgi:hypothetical protein